MGLLIDLYLDLQKHKDFQETSTTFPTCSRILIPRQQTTFENIVSNGEIAQNEQILLLPQYFQIYRIIILSTIEIS